jgi:hypothetical protein
MPDSHLKKIGICSFLESPFIGEQCEHAESTVDPKAWNPACLECEMPLIVGICTFPESPDKGEHCDCAGCTSDDCEFGPGCPDCSGPVDDCKPPTNMCFYSGSGYCGEFCQCVECEENPDCPKPYHCAEYDGDVVTNCTGRVLSCAVKKM